MEHGLAVDPGVFGAQSLDLEPIAVRQSRHATFIEYRVKK
jgi:hypothetical protein